MIRVQSISPRPQFKTLLVTLSLKVVRDLEEIQKTTLILHFFLCFPLQQSFRYEVYRTVPPVLELYYRVGEELDKDNKIRYEVYRTVPLVLELYRYEVYHTVPPVLEYYRVGEELDKDNKIRYDWGVPYRPACSGAILQGRRGRGTSIGTFSFIS